MSYDVSIAVKAEGVDYYIHLSELSNITWNVRELILHSSGWDIHNEAPNGAVKPWVEQIRRGVYELETNPEKYKQYEADNGWGTVGGTLGFYKECLQNVQEWLEYNQYNATLMQIAVIYVC